MPSAKDAKDGSHANAKFVRDVANALALGPHDEDAHRLPAFKVAALFLSGFGVAAGAAGITAGADRASDGSERIPSSRSQRAVKKTRPLELNESHDLTFAFLWQRNSPPGKKRRTSASPTRPVVRRNHYRFSRGALIRFARSICRS
jgi:hypothetical protein